MPWVGWRIRGRREVTGGAPWNRAEETLVCIIIRMGNILFAVRPLCLFRDRGYYPEYHGTRRAFTIPCAPERRTFHDTNVSVLSHQATDAGANHRKNLHPGDHQ